MACHYRGFIFEDYTHLTEGQQTKGMFIFYSVTRLGHEAVLIFFVLSGFLVGGRLIERLREGTYNVKSYIIDRCVRILLPLISALILIAIVNYITDNPNHITISDYIGNLFSLQGIYVKAASGPLWSLSYEVWFYILAGAVAVTITSKNQQYVRYSLLTAFIASLVFTKLNAIYLIIWAMGAIAYSSANVNRKRVILYGSFILMILSIIALQVTSGSQLPTSIEKYLPTTNRNALQVWFGIFCCIYIRQIMLSRPKYRLTNKIEHIGTKLAAFSYTLYLTHIPVMRLMEYLGIPCRSAIVDLDSVLVYIFAIVVSLITAYCIYWCFEKRTQQVKGFIKKRFIPHTSNSDRRVN